MDLLSKIRRIEWNTRKVVDSVLAGQYHARFKGQGMQFRDFREYVPGDDVRHLAWNLNARHEHLFVKQFEEERELAVMVALDVSGGFDFGSKSLTKRDVAAEICGCIAFSAMKNNDRLGFISFDSQIREAIPSKKGKKHVLRIIRDILATKPAKGAAKFDTVIKSIDRLMPHQGIVVIISDFYDPIDFKQVSRLSRRHDVIFIAIRDKIELQPQATGAIRLYDSESGEQFLSYVGRLAAKEWKEQSHKYLEDFKQSCLRQQIDYLPLDTEGDHVNQLVEMFRRRKKASA